MAKDKKVFNGEEVYEYCLNRWEFYRNRDGVYLPSLHDSLVFKEAAQKFEISEKKCEYWFDKIDKPLANKKAKEAILGGKKLELFDKILRENGETPWGLEEIHNKFRDIIAQIESKGIKNLCIALRENADCSQCVDEYTFENPVNIKRYQNGNIEFRGTGTFSYIIEVRKISSVICSIEDSDNEFLAQKKMYKIRMNNGNVVSFYFDFE